MKHATTKHFILLLFLALTWGSSFILMKRGLQNVAGEPVFSPNQVAALRLSIAGLVLLPVSLSAIRGIRREDWKWLAVVGLVGSGFPAFLFTNSQHYLDSSVAGILNSLTPLFTLLVGLAIFRKSVGTKQALGVFIGLLGAIGLIALRGFGNSENWSYSFLIVLATFSYGLSVNTVQNKLTHIPALHITALSLLIIGIPCGIFSFFAGTSEVLDQNPDGISSFGYITLLAIGGTAVANMLYFWLTKQTSALFASSVTYIMPLIAVGWGVLDGEHLTLAHLLCALVILAGVGLVNVPGKVRKPNSTAS